MSTVSGVKAAQLLLQAKWPRLRVDGIWGPRTEEVYARLSVEEKRRVDSALVGFGLTLDDVRTDDVKERIMSDVKPTGTNWLSQSQAEAVAEAAGAEFGVSGSIMIQFLNLEAAQKVVGGIRYYNADSVSPSKLFKGLFQMGSPAWKDVEGSVGVSYKSVFEPMANARAAAAYARQNMRYATQKGYTGKFSGEVLYAMHNQGAAGFMKLLRERKSNRNLENQSGKAKQVIAAALNQNGVVLA